MQYELVWWYSTECFSNSFLFLLFQSRLNLLFSKKIINNFKKSGSDQKFGQKVQLLYITNGKQHRLQLRHSDSPECCIALSIHFQTMDYSMPKTSNPYQLGFCSRHHLQSFFFRKDNWQLPLAVDMQLQCLLQLHQ